MARRRFMRKKPRMHTNQHECRRSPAGVNLQLNHRGATGHRGDQRGKSPPMRIGSLEYTPPLLEAGTSQPRSR